MRRREFLLHWTAALVFSGKAQAGAVEDQLVQQLTNEGYAKVKVSRTLLGRRRIVAFSNTRRREIILNPRTGEILRDYWEEIGESGGSASGLFNNDIEEGEIEDEDDDDDDDEDDDDEDDDDDDDGDDDDGDDDDGDDDDGDDDDDEDEPEED